MIFYDVDIDEATIELLSEISTVNKLIDNRIEIRIWDEKNNRVKVIQPKG